MVALQLHPLLYEPKASSTGFERAIPGFAGERGLLVGIESRSSGPVRVPRGRDRAALGWENLFAMGEGAGFAGGIMSAALDGARCAHAWLTGATVPYTPGPEGRGTR